MNDLSFSLVLKTYTQTHERILTYLRKLTEEQLQWHPAPNVNSIAWHAWHLARWADHIQASFPGMTPELGQRLGAGEQIWQAENLAAQWALDPAQLGWGETGMEMSDEIANSMTFPPKDRLLEYVAKTFAATTRAVAVIDEAQFNSREQPQDLTDGVWGESTVGDAVMEHLIHDNRHLGMIEILLGLQGQRGSASR